MLAAFRKRPGAFTAISTTTGGGGFDVTDQAAILSVNLEAYFQAAPVRRLIPSRFWPRFDLRVEQTATRALDLLDRNDAKATFFVSGWIADHCPDLVAEVARRGHDVASKGYLNPSVARMSLDAFRSDLLRSRDAIERATGRSVRGYRGGEGSLPGDGRAHLEVLAREGFRFDASLRPFGPRFAGRSEARSIHRIAGEGWSITEVPLSSGSLLGLPYPVTGGNYMRQMPPALFDRSVAALRARGGFWHFYFHVWELDPEQPRVSAVRGLDRVRQYRNLDRMRERIEAVMAGSRFESISDRLGLAVEAASPVPAPHPTQVPAAQVPTETSAKFPEFVPTIATGRAVGHAVGQVVGHAVGQEADQEIGVTIVVPCYNEEEALPYLAGSLASLEASAAGTYRFSYVFVDDGSADDTWNVLRRLFGDRPNCQVVQHPRNRGIAAATMTGIGLAKDEIVCGIDCDCSFDPQDLTQMIPLLKPGIDMVQASPYHRDGGVMNVPAWRLLLSRGCCRIYRRLLNHKFSSYTACFRVYRRSAIAPITIEDGGFLGIMEMFVKLDRNGARIVEFPAVLATRLLGVSKMKTLRVIRSHLRLMVRTAMSPSAARPQGNARPAGRPVVR